MEQCTALIENDDRGIENVALHPLKLKVSDIKHLCPHQSYYIIIYNQVHDTVVWLKPAEYHHSCCLILCQLSKWSLCLHGMVQILEINVNDKESATLRILRSTGLKVQVPVEAGKG